MPAVSWPAAPRTASAAEVSAGRLVPWIAIAFGCGIIVYFAIDREPAVWAAVLLVCIAVSISVFARRRFVVFAAAAAFAAVAGGFATATVKRALVAHPVLLRPAWNVELAGFVEAREERERSDRITVRLLSMGEVRHSERLERVRISVRKGTAPAVGTFVELKARL
jgi:competence protein ComEC